MPAANGATSNTPIGPFQSTVLASAIASEKIAADSGPTSRPFQPSGMRSARTMRVAAASVDLLGDHDVGGNLHPPGAEQSPALVDHVGLDERVADRVALGHEERERHRATHEHRVAPVEQRVDDAELVAHLGAAEHRDERSVGESEHRREHLDLAGEQTAGSGRQHSAADRRCEAWARCDAPNASFT